MRQDKLTTKFQQALGDAQSIALGRDHPYIEAVHVLAAIDNGGYFEGDVSKNNLFRDELVSTPYVVDKNGCVTPLEAPGIGVEVNEEFLIKHPVIEGPSYV